MTIMATEFLVFVVAYFVFFSGSCHSAILRTRAGGPEWTFDATAVQWAPNCKDPSPSNPREMKIYTVLRAFDGALELIADAMDRITETHATLSVDEGPSIAQKLQVSEADPAYVQFFKNDYGKERIDRVKDMFEHMHDITANLGEGHRPAGRDGQIKISCSNSWENCVQGSFAFTTPQDEKRESYSQVINFCNLFWSLPTFEERKRFLKMTQQEWSAAIYNGNLREAQKQSLTQLVYSFKGTDAHFVVHELAHIPWIGNANPYADDNDDSSRTNPPEVYGWYNAAKFAADQPNFNDNTYTRNADSYAWYAEYGWWIRALRSSKVRELQRAGDPWPNQGPRKKPVDPAS